MPFVKTAPLLGKFLEFGVPSNPFSYELPTESYPTAGLLHNRERELNKFSRIIRNSPACKDWRIIGRELGLRQADLDAIAHDYPRLKEQCHQMLFKWFCSKGSEATVDTLIKALQSVGFQNVLEEIKEATADN